MKQRLIPVFILIAYGAILVKLMVFKDMPLIRIGPLMLNFGGTHEGTANLIPFKTILPYLLGKQGLIIGGINIVGNIILLVPIGFLVPFVFRNITWKIALALAVVAGLMIEGMQAVLHEGIFDIDDVILNALGVMIGYWVFVILANWLRSGKYKTIAIAAITVIAAAAAALYAIYPKEYQRADFRVDTSSVQRGNMDSAKNKVLQNADPCNGTGGTGHIVSVGNKTITIKGKSGISQIINLTDKTTIRNSEGPMLASDLKAGDGVTVVIDDSETAALVLVCNESAK